MRKRGGKMFCFCDPGGTQTPDLQNRNLSFYSTELRGQQQGAKI